MILFIFLIVKNWKCFVVRLKRKVVSTQSSTIVDVSFNASSLTAFTKNFNYKKLCLTPLRGEASLKFLTLFMAVEVLLAILSHKVLTYLSRSLK
ncbi:hypothetical protein YC2023_082468 [Brassica napus]